VDVALGFRFVLAFVFTAAGLAKLSRRAAFSHAVADYRLLPAGLIRPAAAALPIAETAGGLLLGLGFAIRPISLLLAGLLGMFTVAVTINLVRGRSIECGCFGAITSKQITWLTVVRNLILASMAVVTAAFLPTSLAVTRTARRAISTQDAVAVLLVALTSVLALSLLAEALRVLKAVRDLRRLETKQL
jgi:putative oxidoreductase